MADAIYGDNGGSFAPVDDETMALWRAYGVYGPLAGVDMNSVDPGSDWGQKVIQGHPSMNEGAKGNPLKYNIEQNQVNSSELPDYLKAHLDAAGYDGNAYGGIYRNNGGTADISQIYKNDTSWTVGARGILKDFVLPAVAMYFGASAAGGAAGAGTAAGDGAAAAAAGEGTAAGAEYGAAGAGMSAGETGAFDLGGAAGGVDGAGGATGWNASTGFGDALGSSGSGLTWQDASKGLGKLLASQGSSGSGAGAAGTPAGYGGMPGASNFFNQSSPQAIDLMPKFSTAAPAGNDMTELGNSQNIKQLAQALMNKGKIYG